MNDVTARPPTLSVITAVKNGARYFQECLNSVATARAAGLSIEHIVVDAASTDGTLEMLEGLPDTRVFVEPQLDIIGAIDFALERASGDYVTWLMSDDLLAPNFATLLQRLQADHSDCDVALYALELFSEHWSRILGAPRRISTILAKYPGASSMIVRRSFFLSVDRRPSLRYRLTNDRMTMLALWLKAPCIYISDDVYGAMRVHGANEGNQTGGNNWELLAEFVRLGHDLTHWNPRGPAGDIFAAYAWRRVIEGRAARFRLGPGPRIAWPALSSLPRALVGWLRLKRREDALVAIDGQDGMYRLPFLFAASGPRSQREALTVSNATRSIAPVGEG